MLSGCCILKSVSIFNVFSPWIIICMCILFASTNMCCDFSWLVKFNYSFDFSWIDTFHDKPVNIGNFSADQAWTIEELVLFDIILWVFVEFTKYRCGFLDQQWRLAFSNLFKGWTMCFIRNQANSLPDHFEGSYSVFIYFFV